MTAVTVLKTAPSFLLLGRGKNPATVSWLIADRKLFAAVIELEKEKCPNCGVPIWHGQTAHQAVDFEIEWSVCYGCQAKDELTKDIKALPGEWSHVHAKVAEGFEEEGLPSRSEGLKHLAKPIHST